MGLLDSAKGFFGGASTVKIEPTVIERQAPDQASFPLNDSVFKGQFQVTGEKDCAVLAHVVELCFQLPPQGGGAPSAGGAFVSKRYDHTESVTGRGFDFPYALSPGQKQRDAFLISDVNLPKALATLFPGKDPMAALAQPGVQLILRIRVDVKGSPFDPKVEIPIRVTPPNP